MTCFLKSAIGYMSAQNYTYALSNEYSRNVKRLVHSIIWYEISIEGAEEISRLSQQDFYGETRRTTISLCKHIMPFFFNILLTVHGTATYRCADTRDCIIQFFPPDDEHMCSKHVEVWNKLIIKFSASSWLILINKYIMPCFPLYDT